MASGLPPIADKSKVSSRHFTQPEEFVAAQGTILPRINGPTRRGFAAHLTRIDLDQVRVRVGEATVPVPMVGAVQHCHAFVLGTRSAPPRVLSGHEVTDDTMFHARPNELLIGSSPSGQPWPWATLTLGYATLDRDALALAGRDVRPSRSDATIIRTPQAARRRLLSLAADAARLAVTRPEIAEVPATARALSGAILEALVDCLMQGEAEPDRAAARRHYRVMAKLEDLLHQRQEDVLSLADLCAELGVSARSLQLICQEFAGVGVMQYVRAQRMKEVRRALREADPRRTRIADVAMRYGFWELGRFAGTYRAMFGELPSATLRRAG